MKIEKKNLNEALKVLGKVVSQTSPVEVQKSIRFERSEMLDLDGNCNNAKMERFWGTLKYEDIKIKDYASLPQLRFGVQHYVNFYNAQRIHSALQYKIPDEVYFGICNSENRGYIS